MRLCGLPQSDSNLAIQWHVIAMYGPSFFTGSLIARFGAGRVVMAGLALLAVAALTGLHGIDVAHFWGALILLGLGWNPQLHRRLHPGAGLPSPGRNGRGCSR